MAVSPVDVRIYGRMAAIRWWSGSRGSPDEVKGGIGARDDGGSGRAARERLA
jgi:hypothetical protein